MRLLVCMLLTFVMVKGFTPGRDRATDKLSLAQLVPQGQAQKEAKVRETARECGKSAASIAQKAAAEAKAAQAAQNAAGAQAAHMVRIS